MKKLFLTLGFIAFLGGGYYLHENYTFVQLTPEQLASMNSNGLQSSALSLPDGSKVSETGYVLHVGSFALVKR